MYSLREEMTGKMQMVANALLCTSFALLLTAGINLANPLRCRE
jgi:hypothetical protein